MNGNKLFLLVVALFAILSCSSSESYTITVEAIYQHGGKEIFTLDSTEPYVDLERGDLGYWSTNAYNNGKAYVRFASGVRSFKVINVKKK